NDLQLRLRPVASQSGGQAYRSHGEMQATLHTSPRVWRKASDAARNSSPAAAAGETQCPENHHAAAVGCSDWFAGAFANYNGSSAPPPSYTLSPTNSQYDRS